MVRETEEGLQAVIPAAGLGTRLRRVSGAGPKGLVDVAGRPLLSHVLDRVSAFDPRKIVVVIGPTGQEIPLVLGDHWGEVPLLYVRQSEPRGLAHALLVAAPVIAGDFVVMHGDVVFEPGADLTPVLRRFRSRRADASVLVQSLGPEEVQRGACRVDSRGRVLDATEYPGPEERQWGHVLAGLYACTPMVLEACARIEPSEGGEHELSEALGRLARQGRPVVATELEGDRVNVNTPGDLERAHHLLVRTLPASDES
ncbi:MAG: sugar phosphate nucleotidyltransferase [bacterium]